ncbi:hypothetical protein F7725_012658 [Dissostichus mawsoni]|uniref:Transforming acidic coiled-coil-containing protein C-terminal domain-containing protein n=1 Tax=Dissostichus mawsoni TaxID=36200 RepID=A0A7J5YMZ1_DISMA|nr:hypothetical protein F7725_012658 [Dissostichus mawsoni]
MLGTTSFVWGNVDLTVELNKISDSEGMFETPEAESPGVVKHLSQLDNSNHTVTNHFLDNNSNQEVSPDSSTDVDSLNNISNSTTNNRSFGLDQNLNLTLSNKPSPGGVHQPQPPALRPPSLSVLSSLNKPDPSEVDDAAPAVSDSSTDSNSTRSHDICVDPDLLNGNMNSNTKLTCETNGTVITNSCKVKPNQPMQKDFSGQDDHHGGHATDEEKLAISVKPDKDQSAQDCHVTSKPEDCCSVQFEDPCERKNKAEGGEMKKTGSQVLDSICISEAEKQAVLTLIREEIITKEAVANNWKKKYEESKQEVSEMRKIVAEYEKTIAQMIGRAAQHQDFPEDFAGCDGGEESTMADLNSVERSLSDVFRRYENLKSTLEGFKKNEEVLKKCAQEYLARVKQEEQRYQTLKIHAEEKLDKANEEIAQVRGKASSENMAMAASLRKEQMKNEPSCALPTMPASNNLLVIQL